MELSVNYGVRRYFINDNWFYFLLFIFSLIFFLKQKKKRNIERETMLSNLRGGENSLILQKLYDQCLSDDFYVQVTDSKIKKIIRRMLNISGNKPIIISAPVYLLAILKKKSAPLILTSGGTKLIVSNFRGFMSKGIGTVLFAKLLAVGSGAIILSSMPLVLTVLLYANLHIDCGSFVDKLPTIEGDFQYIETIIDDNAPIIVAPHTGKTLYHEFDETKVSSFRSLSCYLRDNCLGPEQVQRKSNLKPKRFVPLKERTKTLKDLKSHIDEMDAIDVNAVKLKQEN